jgi:hypothetical protein
VKTAMQMLETVAEMSRKMGPYVLLELLLPGGTLFAFTLFLYRHPGAVRGYVGRLRRAAAGLMRKARRALARRWKRAPSRDRAITTTLRAAG